MNRGQYVWGVALAAVGAVLALLGAAQDFFGLQLFSSSPLLVGVAVGTIGACFVAGARRPRGN